ncbi:MAG: hypothetical protein AB7P94_16725 [Steroidobacteraceae bacterium]
MNLIEDAKNVFLRAWSVRLSLLAAAFSAAEVALPFFAPFVPEHTMLILAVITSAGAAIARIVAQPAMHEDKAEQ